MNSSAISGYVADALDPCLVGGSRSRFAIAGISVEVQGNDPQAADLGPQLLPFATVGDTPADIDVQVEWSSTITPARGRELFHSGCLWNVREFGDGFLFDFVTEHLGPKPYKRLLVDKNFQHSRVILNQECLTADDASRALEYPLDELLITHHLSLGRGVELHSCGMVREDGESFLLVGHSGAGKSTTARLWTQHLPVEVLSDDRIIVGRTLPSDTADFCRHQINSNSVGQECPTHKSSHNFVMHGTPWHGEAAFASPGRAPLRRIFLLEHGPENRIERLSPGAAVGELLARSFTPFYQSRFVDPVLALLEELVDALPVYRFHFVPDRSAVEKILEFRD